ncbi:non-homologous end joining protein Ku [Dietzia sp. NCCP-2495]|uniref:non-homologous end joining protein Ku n=1 Tax=Dietzia sp. NCCP-2495 TaxID=2934675 RepID=UPI002231F208|nr:Ku protein [Dietzia sp. NCCP-2495]GLB64900.1 non-homologous end joining protein Ku [Dietzia sp. NCCP-2495]
MRSIWKGEVSFGLVNVPVKVYAATEDHDLHARQVDKKDGVRIRYKKVRDDNGEEVEFSDIAKAYESEEGEMVILTKDDLASLPVEQNHEIEVTEFVPADQVDPVAFDNAYFLEPASRSNRAYVLMREALQQTDRLAICTFTLRNRTRLCALRVYKDVLMLQTLLWPDEIRPAILEGLDKEAKVRPQEVKMAASLIETMAADFEPEKYEDDYQNQLKELIEAKAAGGEAFTVEEKDTSGDDGDDEVADLLAALRASVKDRGGKADDADDQDDDESDDDEDSGSAKKATSKKSGSSSAKKTPAKKTAAKKAPARKAAAKKSTAKKSTAKKSTSSKSDSGSSASSTSKKSA